MVGGGRHELRRVGGRKDCLVSIVMTGGHTEAARRKLNEHEHSADVVQSRSDSFPSL